MGGFCVTGVRRVREEGVDGGIAAFDAGGLADADIATGADHEEGFRAGEIELLLHDLGEVLDRFLDRDSRDSP